MEVFERKGDGLYVSLIWSICVMIPTTSTLQSSRNMTRKKFWWRFWSLGHVQNTKNNELFSALKNISCAAITFVLLTVT